MRPGNNANIIKLDDGTFFGFDLSSDFCAEHEWGIKKLLAEFGLDNDKGLGIDRLKIKKIPEKPTKDTWSSPRIIDFFQSRGWKKESYLLFERERNINDFKEHKPFTAGLTLTKNNTDEVVGSWDGDSFGIGTTKYHDELKELYDAFLRKDIVIGLFGGHVFQNSGLKILIASRVPEDMKKLWYDTDKDQVDLKKADVKTGIRKKLEKANKKFFALSPKWAKDIRGTEGKTKYRVAFWLNPVEQSKYNSCWCTVEDLEQWIQEKGVIVK